MSRKQQEVPEPNRPFSIRIIYVGYGAYDIVFSYQKITVFKPISDEQYRVRKLCYLRPVRAKNYLLDLVSFDGMLYSREDFKFIGKDGEPSKDMIALWQEIEKACLLFTMNFYYSADMKRYLPKGIQVGAYHVGYKSKPIHLNQSRITFLCIPYRKV